MSEKPVNNHQRTIGLIIIACVMLLLVPIIETSKERPEDLQTPEVFFPNNNEVTVIEIGSEPEIENPVPPDANSELNLTPPELPVLDATRKWQVEIADITRADPIKINELKIALKKHKFVNQIKQYEKSGKGRVKFLSPIFENLKTAKRYKIRLNAKLSRYNVNAKVVPAQ
jgi:hypothetical protein